MLKKIIRHVNWSMLVRKTVSEAGDKLEAGEKESIEGAISDLEESIKGDDVDDLKTKTNALMEASHKLAERMYQEQDDASDSATDTASGADAGAPGGDDIVDAEFEEIKDKKDD